MKNRILEMMEILVNKRKCRGHIKYFKNTIIKGTSKIIEVIFRGSFYESKYVKQLIIRVRIIYYYYIFVIN